MLHPAWEASCKRRKKTERTIWFSLTQNWCTPSVDLFDTRMYERPSLSGCDDAAFTVCTICYTSVAQCQGRQVRRDSGLERRHPVFSLYSRETEECSLFIFIQMKLELTASAIHCNKWFLKSESRIFFLFKLKSKQKKIQAEETKRKLFRFNLNISSILKSSFKI